MDLKTLLGESYREDMTHEEINTAIADKNLFEAAKAVDKTVFDRTASELAKANRELKEIKSSSLTAEQKLQQAIDEANSTKSQFAREMVKLKAKEVFVTAGLTEADYGQILDGILSDSEDDTLVRAKSIVGLITAQKSATEKNVRAELLKGTPKPQPGPGNPPEITKEQFDKMDWKERVELKQKDLELFKKLNQ